MNPAATPLIQVLALALMGIGLFVIAWAAASAPTASGQRLGLRGLKRQRALENVPFWATLEPLVRWLGARCSGLIGQGFRDNLNRKISLAGDFMGLLAEEVVGLCIVTGLAGAFMGFVLGQLSGLGSIATIGALLLCTAQPYMHISGAGVDRMKAVSRRLPYAVDLLSLSMGAGLDFPGAVRQVVEKTGNSTDPVVEEFTLILQNLQLGRTRRDALEVFAARVPANLVVEFVGAVVQAEIRGNPVADVLRIQAEVARRKRSVRGEESAAKAGVAMMGPLVLVFVAILIIIVAPIALKLKGAS